jgi:hypothetical protein
MHQRCVRSRLRRRGGSGRVVADIAKLSVGREEYYTRELATHHQQYLSGHGESPGRWYGTGAASLGLQGEASVAGFRQMFEGRDPTTGELLGRPTRPQRRARLRCGLAADQERLGPVRPGRPRDRPGRCWRPTMPAWPRRSLTWMDTWAPVVATAVSNTCLDRGCWRSASITARAAKGIRCCTPTWWSPTAHRAGRALDGVGRPGPVPASAGR